MALLLENGSGWDEANAYVDLVFADEYHAGLGRTDWAAATSANKQSAIVRATAHVDRRYGARFIGTPSTTTQSLEWPRVDAYDVYGNLLEAEPAFDDVSLVVTAVDFATNDTVDFADDHDLLTGDGPFQLTTTGTLPTGLSLATDYWVIIADDDTLAFATTLERALLGTKVNLTDAGTGTHTVASTDDTVLYRLPIHLKRAVAEYALQALRLGELTPLPPSPVQLTDLAGTRSGSTTLEGTSTRKKVGPIEIENSTQQGALSSSSGYLPKYPDADLIIARLLKPARGYERW